jgi:hypothetical protein
VIATALLVALVLAVALLVGSPLLRTASDSDAIARIDPAATERLRLREERDDAIAGLQELDFDLRTGKINQQDHDEAAAPLRARIAAAVAALE